MFPCVPRSVPGEPSRFVYQSGQDCFGRHVVVLLGARLPPLGLQDERTIPLFVKELEALQHETWFKYEILFGKEPNEGAASGVLMLVHTGSHR